MDQGEEQVRRMSDAHGQGHSVQEEEVLINIEKHKAGVLDETPAAIGN